MSSHYASSMDKTIFNTGFHSAMQHLFGMLQVGRNFNSPEYKYSFNGQLKDDELKGDANSYDYGFRMYDARLSRFATPDPMRKSFPHYSPYNFAANRPIVAIDMWGLQAWDAPNSAGNVFALVSWYEHVITTAQKMTSADDLFFQYFDCADVGLYLMITYYRDKGVPLTLTTYDGRTISSNDPKYSGDNAFNDFFEDARTQIGSSELKSDDYSFALYFWDGDDLVQLNHYPGDIIASSRHIQIYIGSTTALQSSGAYYGKDDPRTKNETGPVEYTEPMRATAYRFNFLRGVPYALPSEMPQMRIPLITTPPVEYEHIKATPVPGGTSPASGESKGEGGRRKGKRDKRESHQNPRMMGGGR